MPTSTHRILIADDHQALRNGVCSVLEADSAWQVVGQAADGEEALRLARETTPDIAILDFSLPDMDGLELTRAIKQELPRTEILLYTMYSRESMFTDAIHAGISGCVLKSDSTDHLLAAVRALSRRRPYFSSAISDILLGSGAAGSRSSVLTDREREVVRLVAEGNTNKQSAELLGISVKTVETHRATAMHKLKFSATAELVLYAIRNDIIQS
jgi:DNA-binding NarL/FixJ family response regulator